MPHDKSSIARIEAFRRARRVGERLTGRLLRWEGDGLGLVNIQGHELTALVASNPAPGQTLHFIVERLYPDVVLRELHAGPGGGLSPAMLFNDFRKARMQADEALKSAEAQLTALELQDPVQRKKAFHGIVAADPALVLPLSKLLASVAALNSILKPVRGVELSSPNWLLPGAASRELLVFDSGSGGPVEARFFCLLPIYGRCEARLLQVGGKYGLKVLMEEQPPAKALSKLLAKELPKDAAVDFLGAVPLPPESRAGIVARELGLDISGPSGFDRRV